MGSARREEPPVSWPKANIEPQPYSGPPRNVEPISHINWDKSLQPRKYSIFGTHTESKILFLNVNILDSSGREPYIGDVLVEGPCVTKYLWASDFWARVNNHHRRAICCNWQRPRRRKTEVTTWGQSF